MKWNHCLNGCETIWCWGIISYGQWSDWLIYWLKNENPLQHRLFRIISTGRYCCTNGFKILLSWRKVSFTTIFFLSLKGYRYTGDPWSIADQAFQKNLHQHESVKRDDFLISILNQLILPFWYELPENIEKSRISWFLVASKHVFQNIFFSDWADL